MLYCTTQSMGVLAMVKQAERIPNERLDALMKEAGVGPKGLARKMRDFSLTDGGTPLKTAHGNVQKWLSGETRQPERRACEVLCVVLGGLIGRRLTVRELGWALEEASSNCGDTFPQTLTESVTALEVLTAGSSISTKLVVVPQAWADLLVNALFGSEGSVQVEVPSRITEMEVRSVHDAVAMFSSFDYKYGGGRSKSLVAKFFETSVLPCIRNADPSTEIGRQYFQASAMLARLAGWTAYDMGEHGLAQRYLYNGFKLAKVARDKPLCGRLLAGMSHQANFLGHYEHAVHLARAAAHIAEGYATPTVMSLFHAMEARAQASLGNEQGVTLALAAAERFMNSRNVEDDPDWIKYFDEAELHAEYAHSYRDLGRPEIAMNFAASSIAEADSLYVRSVQFVRTVYATAHIQERELDEAVAVASSVVDTVAHLDSHRLICYLVDFRRRLHGAAAGERITRTFDEHAFAALGSKGFPSPDTVTV